MVCQLLVNVWQVPSHRKYLPDIVLCQPDQHSGHSSVVVMVWAWDGSGGAGCLFGWFPFKKGVFSLLQSSFETKVQVTLHDRSAYRFAYKVRISGHKALVAPLSQDQRVCPCYPEHRLWLVSFSALQITLCFLRLLLKIFKSNP